MKKLESVFYVLCGALLLGFLWKLRGTHGWGAAWGLLSCGFVFLLYLTAVLDRPVKSGFPLLCLTSFAFMLTTPGWGTLLESITGVLSVDQKGSEETLQAFVNPLSGIFLMLCLGFGLASVFGVLTGQYFGEKKWRVRDYVILLLVFVIVGEIAKITLAHGILRLVEPQASDLFAQGLQKEGIAKSAYAAYMSHYGNMSWAKKILGGRHYFSSVSTIAFALQAVAVLCTVRFYIKDHFAAKVGLVVCASFAFAITVADLFFFYSNGGYHMQQGYSLPETVYAWSMWEYGTGFIAGGLITGYLLHCKPPVGSETTEKCTVRLSAVIQKQSVISAAFFLFCFVGAFGLNAVRPVLRRLDESAWHIPGTVLAACAALVIAFLICRKYGFCLQSVKHYPRFAGWLCIGMVLWYAVLYFVFPDAQITEIQDVHNQFVFISFIFMLLWFFLWRTKERKKA